MIILASQSEIRRAILKAAGVSFLAATSPADELSLQTDLKKLAPRDMAIALANTKASAFDPLSPDDFIIGVDQTCELNGDVLHKSKNKSEAKQQLLGLNGKSHKLHTAYSIYHNHKPVADHCETSTLTMRVMSEEFIDSYLASIPEHTLTAVGCYQLEGLGIQLMQDIEGDHFSILGLPLLHLLAHLRDLGALPT